MEAQDDSGGDGFPIGVGNDGQVSKRASEQAGRGFGFFTSLRSVQNDGWDRMLRVPLAMMPPGAPRSPQLLSNGYLATMGPISEVCKGR